MSEVSLYGGGRSYMNRNLNQDLSGNEDYNTACSGLVISNISFSKLHCQNGFNAYPFSCKITCCGALHAASMITPTWYRDWGSRFGVQGAGCRIQGAECRVQGSGYGVQGTWCRVQGSGCRVQGEGFRVQGAGCKVEG